MEERSEREEFLGQAAIHSGYNVSSGPEPWLSSSCFQRNKVLQPNQLRIFKGIEI